MDDIVLDGVEALEEVSEFQPLVLSANDYLSRCLDVFSDTLRIILRVPVLRFFAVVGLVCVAVGLCRYLLRTGKTLAY